MASRTEAVVAVLLLAAAPGLRAADDHNKHASGQQTHASGQHQQAQHQSQSQHQPVQQHASPSNVSPSHQSSAGHQSGGSGSSNVGHQSTTHSGASSGGHSSGSGFGANTSHQSATHTQPSGQGRQFGNGAQSAGQGHQFGGQTQHGAASSAHTYTPRAGIHPESGPGNRQIYHSPNGGQVHMDHGRVVEVHTSGGAIIHHGPEGYRRVEYVRPGGRTVVISGHGGGYVQHTLIISNHSFVQRTYWVNGVAVARVYRPFAFGGISLALYTPMHFWRHGFYVYAYNPWVRAVVYTSWGWTGTPWFGFYSGYFTPAPSYAGPADWLTDYIIAGVLQDAYQQRVAANLAISSGYYAGHPGLTPDAREAVALEVGRQLRQEEAEAATGGNAAAENPFTGATHVFVANTTVEGMAGAQSCAITGGDVLEMRGAPPLGAATAPVMVRSSKWGGCPRGAVVMVAVQDLVEMDNHMRDVMDRGLAELQHRHGQGGLPPMPAEAAAPATPVAWASQVRPDAGVENEINQVSTDASRAEQETVNATVQGPASEADAAPAIGIGSTVDEVVAAWGKPVRTADLGGKKIYVYKDVKVTFQDGKVVDVQ